MSANRGEHKRVVAQATESPRVIKTFKRRAGFSGVRRICTVCQVKAIHPNDACYAARVCFRCATEGLQPSGSLRAPGLRPATRLLARARSLRENTPKSERWFQDWWKRLGMQHPADEFNVPFGFFIPDCINHEFKYVIEVDGDMHSRKTVKKQDARKDRYYAEQGYTVYRLTAYDNADLEALCNAMDGVRNPPRQRSPKYILRKSQD